ncbi:MAG TPA: PmoA family protein [Abditibacteriaceae bacterium]
MKHLFTLGGLLLTSTFSNAAPKITVAAGDYERRNTIVSFPFKDAKGKALRAAGGTLLPLQSRGDTAFFILPQLEKGTAAAFDIVEGPASGNSVDAKRDGAKVKFTLNGKPVFDYQAEPGELPREDIKKSYVRGGYIQSVWSPSGRLVTDDFPPNHIHHHGIWFPWTKTEFEGRHPDFWNMGSETGRVEFVALNDFHGGPVFGGLTSQHQFVDMIAKPAKIALNEAWQVQLFNAGNGTWIFDLLSTQKCASDSPLKLPKYHYGGLGIRGHRDWNGAGKTQFVTSEGIEGTKANETRGNWAWMGGLVDQMTTGIAVLGHPQNFRAPQPFRAHPSEPFLCLAPSQLGDWEIKPGEDYISRYRFIVRDGAPDKDELNRLWNDYAHPPQVTIEK